MEAIIVDDLPIGEHFLHRNLAGHKNLKGGVIDGLLLLYFLGLMQIRVIYAMHIFLPLVLKLIPEKGKLCLEDDASSNAPQAVGVCDGGVRAIHADVLLLNKVEDRYLYNHRNNINHCQGSQDPRHPRSNNNSDAHNTHSPTLH